jgi:DNA-binding GntR family transcriptional regulator
MESEILRDSVREKIIELVLAGKLKPGERIKELSISHIIKVSRTPLREALISLERAGLVRSEPNIGFTIKEVSVNEVEELYPLLILLESHALLLAFPLVQTQIKDLERINETLYLKRKSPKEASLADREFHGRLTELCRNETLLRMISELRLRISCYQHCYMVKSEQLERSFEQHQDIITALKGKDVDGAKKALSANWEYGKIFLIAKLTQRSNKLPGLRRREKSSSILHTKRLGN